MTRGFRASLSVSPFTETLLADGWRFTDGQRTAAALDEVQQLFVAHGATEVYARIATRRVARSGDAELGLDAGLRLARLARTMGLPFNPEIGMWSVYGDLALQPAPDFSDYPMIDLPGPWHTLTVPQMAAAFRIYGAEVAREIRATGVEVAIWDLGNEVDYGVAGVAIPSFTSSMDEWSYTAPDGVDPEIGRMPLDELLALPRPEEWLRERVWPAVAALFAAVAEGIRSVDPTARFSTHTCGVRFFESFFAAMDENGFVVDELGTSYYPTIPTGVEDQFRELRDAAEAAHTRLGRPVFLAETSYPSGPMIGAHAWNDAVPGYPIDPVGPYRFYRDLVAWGAGSGLLSGIRPWAPDYASGNWQPMSHFAAEGTLAVAAPVLDAIADGLAEAGATSTA
jgi:hypothetical protein